MVLIDCIIRFFGKEELLKASYNTNLLYYVKKVIKKIRSLHQEECWEFYSYSGDFFDFKFYFSLEHFLSHIQENSTLLPKEKGEIEDLIWFIKEMKVEIKKKKENFE